LRQRQAAKGQILILVLLALIGLVLIFGLISMFSVRVRAAPRVTEAFWTTRDQTVTTISLGAEVKAHVMVQAREEYVGTMVIMIKKDVRLWFDSDYHISTIPVNLKGGDQKELEADFTPDEASGGSLRGYFIEIEFKVTRTRWTMENTYPPRLTVELPKSPS